MRKIMIRTLKSVCASTSLLERTLIGCFVGAYYLKTRQESSGFSFFLGLPEFIKQSDLLLKFNMAESGAGGDNKYSTQGNLNENNGLVLYYHHHSFYAQKVIMALYEKKIPFSTKLVDITKGEQYQPWYLKINPKGEVPVLKDGVKLIPDSVRIIDYLEDNFSNGEHARLIPMDQGPEIRQKILHFRAEIDKLPANVITVGSFFHPDFCTNLRYPFFIPSVRKHLKAAEKKSSASLRETAEKNPESRDVLLQKANAQDKKHLLVTDKSEYLKVLAQVDQVLDEVEEELASHAGERANWWLCSDRFTIADISLTILLDRLSRVGLANHFWGEGKRPHLREYYQRVQNTDSYKKAVPTPMTDISLMFQSRGPIILGVSLVTIITVVVGGYFYFKKA